MEPWYNVTTPREEVRKGRSFNPDEFAIHLEQVIAGTAPEDYRNPEHFFSRTCFTAAMSRHIGMVLRRLDGQTSDTAPVMALMTQFGGGKTHTLTALYHLANNGTHAAEFPGISDLIAKAGVRAVPETKTAVFVGSAWDPHDGCETPWIDIARQLAGEQGVKKLGKSAKTTPPGTDTLGRLCQAAEKPVLILFDEVLNFLNRHRDMAEPFYAFIDNLVRTITGITRGAALVSLPQSRTEMTDWDLQWQDKISKVVGRVARDMISNDEAEISEVVRRRLFEDPGDIRIRKNVAKKYADWCFERRAQLPPELTAVDTATTAAKSKTYLRSRFEACYPFHPATLSVFQRKWQTLPQYQQTRGTLSMLAQWISHAYRESHVNARNEALITLGSAPLDLPEFRSMVIRQVGESRLDPALNADISGPHSHAYTLDQDTKGHLKNIHQRTGTVVFFESSGGQINKMAHLPEIRFAAGEPNIDTTSVDNAVFALKKKAYFIRQIGSDGFKISHTPTLRKVANDRRASLDRKKDVMPAMRRLIQEEFKKGASLPISFFPKESTDIQDTHKLTLIVADSETEWRENNKALREQTAEWIRQRGKSPRLYPASLVWCFRKPGQNLRGKTESWLAWKKVSKEAAEGILGRELTPADRTEIKANLKDEKDAARDEVWGSYRFAVIWDRRESDSLKQIDLGAGHSGGETLCDRVITALKSQAILNETVGAGYIERNWPLALKPSGAWSLGSLRKSFLDGSLTRLLDPDTVLREKITDYVKNEELGLASGQRADGTYDRVWFSELVGSDEISFEQDVFLLTRAKAKELKAKADTDPDPEPDPDPGPDPDSGSDPDPGPDSDPGPAPDPAPCTLNVMGEIPPEIWNRLGTKIIPRLRTGKKLRMGIRFSVVIDKNGADSFESDLSQILSDLGISDKVRISRA